MDAPALARSTEASRPEEIRTRKLHPDIVTTLTLAAILLVAVFVRAHGLGRESLWFDEAATARVATASWSDFLPRFRHSETTPPPYYILLKIWVGVFGASETSLRAPSVLAGAGVVWFLWRFGMRIGGTAVGLTAAALTAVWPFHVEYAREARVYVFMLLLALWSTDQYLRLAEDRRPRAQWWYILATVLLLHSHLYALTTVAAQNVAYLVQLLRRRAPLSPRAWLSVQAAAAFVAAPSILWMLKLARIKGAGGTSIPAPGPDELALTFLAYCGSSGVLLLASVMLMILGVGNRRLRPHLPLLLSLLLVPTVVPLAVSYLFTPVFMPRYGIVATAPFLLFIAAGIARLRPAPVAAIVTAGVAGVALWVSLTLPDWKGDWRAAGAYLQRTLRPGDDVVVTNPHTTILYDHYMPSRSDVRRRGLYSNAVPLGLPLPEGKHVWAVFHAPHVYPRDVINHAYWRVVSQRAFHEVLILELADGVTD
ncbi:MAG: glycosyltransferase family 39 protein, partial [Tepidisphaeraceae bacterium]